MSEDIHEVAARWHTAQLNDDMDWDGFTAWLEADPRHRLAYDEIALLDARIDDVLPELAQPIEMPSTPARRLPRWAIGSGIAAAAAVAIAVGIGFQTSRPEAPAAREFASAAGSTRTVQVADGVTATLGAGSRLSAAATGASMRLHGSAFFSIRHDPTRSVTVEVGGYRIRDVGTRFTVNAADGVLSLSVEEGKVALQLPGQSTETIISAGQEALARSGAVSLRPVRIASIASWRQGRFVYDQAPLSLVAADIARYTGQPVTIAGSAASRSFSGVLAPGDRAAMVSTLTQLTGLHADSDGQTVRLVDRTGG
ncbi:FecR family protein [Sphingomonas kyeonggiensis]|uniref:Transmembrane sensor n=1 Tax=Sphingomonas kyeonggiensis TaxID=1268553 RepID=A0A7W6NZT7_9SPHN|nr:FecR domain-containing protein [Sphingomonas kyeonggiensis]MBB4101151.1 transmembrane sensor [Sphingomonas kyeonggiensis]